jgi:glycosyltransferase involved in cell wall biosynthesis
MDHKNNILVSVLMTAYNRERYIAEAIESVLASNYPTFELIIVDDCSKDKTAEIAKNYALKDERIKVYINEKNLGDYPNRNKATAFAIGKYLMFVDSDDSILPDAIEYIVSEFAKHPTVNFSLLYYQKDITIPKVLKPNESIRNHFFKKGFLDIGPGGTVIKHDFFKRIGGFPEKYGPANDMYYNLKAASNSDILLLPYIYLNYRIHEGQQKNDQLKYLIYNFQYLTDAMKIPDFPLSEIEKQKILKKSARQNLFSILKLMRNLKDVQKIFSVYKLSGIKLKDLL